MKKHLMILALFILLLETGHPQTYVSGGIYANTIWTLANNPYIVTDTIVVFPNVTLTIEPGVTVKFADLKRIEIRQAKLVAMGTGVDSITFTSNSAQPEPGSYSGIYLNGGDLTSTFNFCKFRYAAIGIHATISGLVNLNNSSFSHNITGLQCTGSSSGTALIAGSLFDYNTTGLVLENLFNATVNYCIFSFNSNTGISLQSCSDASTSFCNFLNNGTGLSMNIHNSLMNHCHFSNNISGLEGGTGEVTNHFIYPNNVKNSLFDYNQTGLSNIDEILIDSCTIVQNQTGYQGAISRIKHSTVDSNTLVGISSCNDSIINCIVKHNGTGIEAACSVIITNNDIEYNTGANINSATFKAIITGNTIRHGNVGIDNLSGNFIITSNKIDNNNSGINLKSSTGTLSCNSICNNTAYDLNYMAAENLDASHNYWCADSAMLEALIFDGYDNINYGLVNFMPFDQSCTPTETSINEKENNHLLNIYPNPTSGQVTILTDRYFNDAMLKVYNSYGQQVKQISNISGQTVTLFLENLLKGLYYIRITEGNKTIATNKLVITY
jgi:hypothetical protein